MYIVVNHEISDTSRFWATAQSATSGLTEGLKVIHTLPSPDGRKAVCVWEADSVDAVRNFLESGHRGHGAQHVLRVGQQGRYRDAVAHPRRGGVRVWRRSSRTHGGGWLAWPNSHLAVARARERRAGGLPAEANPGDARRPAFAPSELRRAFSMAGLP